MDSVCENYHHDGMTGLKCAKDILILCDLTDSKVCRRKEGEKRNSWERFFHILMNYAIYSTIKVPQFSLFYAKLVKIKRFKN